MGVGGSMEQGIDDSMNRDIHVMSWKGDTALYVEPRRQPRSRDSEPTTTRSKGGAQVEYTSVLPDTIKSRTYNNHSACIANRNRVVGGSPQYPQVHQHILHCSVNKTRKTSEDILEKASHWHCRQFTTQNPPIGVLCSHTPDSPHPKLPILP